MFRLFRAPLLRPLFFGLLALAVVPLSPPASAAPREVRGTWLTTTGPDSIRSGLRTAATAAELRRVGINTVYGEAWKNGATQFASPTLAAFTGGIDRSLALGSRDLVEEVGIQAHRQGQLHYAWFEYGLAAQFVGSGGTPSNPLAKRARERGWLLQDASGRYANGSNGFAWMNPAVPEVRELIVGITLDSIRRHDLDGVQFDDRLAWPAEFGFDATTAALYREQTGRSLPARADDAAFRSWRQDQVTTLAREISRAVRAEAPGVRLSLSPSVTGFSDRAYNAPWTRWLEEGLFDEYVPQVYRADLAAYRQALTQNAAPFQAGGRLGDLVVGLRLNGSGADTELGVLRQQIVDAALLPGGGAAGHAIFYAKGVLENADALAAFYGGERDPPFFASDRRPPPRVASPDAADGLWRVEVAESMSYRVVAEIAGRWVEVDRRFLAAGPASFAVPGATAVELLVDRRARHAVPEPAAAAVLLLAPALVARRRRAA
ncbi:glycoside hydrolase family 10 protein [Phycisphaera mikurensis]|uniref:Glycosyl hydrolase-like 10 domain-containing protein n=1 Tax=Phycisphaera mikurensis (strain NBRC 102666 / KCTC 22515 / FYK2301M01) TaxID=1142394 RepID=I0IG83_PHYMF|nr:family 10 glycosylhydrolase [Phycisphaera mikurensis]MBB6440347.1 uncharacterized lipoprotein YddW (UPF0748 family) [Phycisphaera mikurensis]BAM04271.1 hypothetical protein PSMK_21120 [Phycisphaera mikurensis NBRC 102666]